ncbi:MAG TPA: crossover junction endodeoxyribonuclease RuvC [Polyangia bacterium]|nr:crossover junction endodeoxyribonuclease RuvC [Polyangia bacterium]
MRILGIDPGSGVTGYGVVERTRRGIVYVECGVIAPRRGLALPVRLVEIASELRAVIEELTPDVAAVENLFHATHARAALVLGHARGVVLETAARAGLRVFEYPPATVKRAVAGSGRASKPEVSAMVRAACGLRRAPRPDAADALAVALCHAYTGAK